MTAVFIGGSRQVRRLNADIRRRIDRIVERRLPVLIGDAHGADRAVQTYLKSRGYEKVEVFCMEGECRNNVGNWRLRAIPAHRRAKDFTYYATKDRVMAQEASVGFMIWDGRSAGTLANVARLLGQHKKVVVYNVLPRSFTNLMNEADWERFLSSCPPDVRERVERQMSAEEMPSEVQGGPPGLFGG
jgi:adenine-specific DNA-methyltransferase